MTLKQLRRQVLCTLQEHKIDSPEADSGLLIMHVLGIDKTQLLTRDTPVSGALVTQVQDLVHRRISGEPIQYILGSCEFMSRPFHVTPDVLIPRPDTEILVEAVLERLKSDPGEKTQKDNSKPWVWDLGCGSGCIGISLAAALPFISVMALDISASALEIAHINGQRCKVDNRMTFMQWDIRRGMPPNRPIPHCIVSNPPYIPTGDISGLQREVQGFEPLSALDGGPDGLDFYRDIASKFSPAAGGLLAFEIGCDQGASVAEILHQNEYQSIEVLPDLAGRDRVVLGRR